MRHSASRIKVFSESASFTRPLTITSSVFLLDCRLFFIDLRLCLNQRCMLILERRMDSVDLLRVRLESGDSLGSLPGGNAVGHLYQDEFEMLGRGFHDQFPHMSSVLIQVTAN